MAAPEPELPPTLASLVIDVLFRASNVDLLWPVSLQRELCSSQISLVYQLHSQSVTDGSLFCSTSAGKVLSLVSADRSQRPSSNAQTITPTTETWQGDLETSLDEEEVFKRACVGLSATIPARVREAIEAGHEHGTLQDDKDGILTLKNVWSAPPPPEGTTGCGTDGK